MVFNKETEEIMPRGTKIQDSQAFVIFDEFRTRGSDIKMSKDVKAVITLSPNISKDSFMQAVGRLRKIGRDQKIYIFLPTEVEKLLEEGYGYKKSLELDKKIKIILKWLLKNTFKELQNLVSYDCNHAVSHLKSLITRNYIERSTIEPAQLFKHSLKEMTVIEQCNSCLSKIELESNGHFSTQ